MWSDSDSQYSQWALNPSAYQNVSHEQVDWGALAQRWIQMKDTCPPRVPDAPPPPPLGPDDKKNTDIEGGEAPMDMDKEEVSGSSSVQDSPAWGSWNNWQSQPWSGWGWGSGGVAPPGGVPPPPPAALIGKQSGSMPMPGFNYNPTAGPGFAPPAPGMYNYNQGPPGSGADFNRAMMGDYWNAGPHTNNSGNAAVGQGPVPFIRTNRPYWSKRNNRNDRSHSADNSEEEAEDDHAMAFDLDAAKRRQLPAWIREGLEKMERDKQKKIDSDRQIKEREIYLQKKREEEDAMNELQNSSGQPMIPKKSKFDTDSEESDHNEEPALIPSSSKRKSRFRNADSPASTPQRAVVKEPSPEPRPQKSKEEIQKETDQKLRAMLLSILLEVTTEEMESVAKETITKALKKAPAAQLQKTPALASLTGKLGLGIYGDSEDSDSGGESDGRDSDNQSDSDEELKDRIERRKNEFAKTEREIEARLQEAEERENRMAAEGSEDSEGEERQVVNNQTDKRPKAFDGIKIKEEPEDVPRHQLEHPKHEETFQVGNKEYFNPPAVKKEIKYEHITGRRSDKKGVQVAPTVKPLLKVKLERQSSDEAEEETSKSDSDSSSSSKSSSSAVKASSPESRRTSKKRSKNGRDDKSSERRKSSYSSEVKQKKSSDRSKERKHSRESKDRKEKKKDKRDRSRSKEIRRSRRSPSRESRRSKRSPSRESRMSKSSRRNGDISASKGSDRHRHYSSSTRGSHKSRKSLSRERSYSKSRISNKSANKSRENSLKEDRRQSRRSRSPVKEKRKRRESTRSHSSCSVSDKRDRYSRSRSSSTPSPRKKSRRRGRSSSSGRSSRATGKTAGH